MNVATEPTGSAARKEQEKEDARKEQEKEDAEKEAARKEQEKAPWDTPEEWAWVAAHAERWAAADAAAAAAADEEQQPLFAMTIRELDDSYTKLPDCPFCHQTALSPSAPVSIPETPPQRAIRRVDDMLQMDLDDLFGSPSPKKHRVL